MNSHRTYGTFPVEPYMPLRKRKDHIIFQNRFEYYFTVIPYCSRIASIDVSGCARRAKNPQKVYSVMPLAKGGITVVERMISSVSKVCITQSASKGHNIVIRLFSTQSCTGKNMLNFTRIADTRLTVDEVTMKFQYQ